MLWPVLLLIAGLVSAIVGLVAAFSAPFHTPTRLHGALVFLFPGGGLIVVVAVVWLLFLFVRSLA